MLLILDNCEHLTAACSQFADTLLRACPNLQILATSRETFGITGERNYQVRPLSLPDPQGKSNGQALANFEAVRLFAERAKYALDGFSVSEENADAVAQVCARLDGMPLAIELAAARVKALTVEQIAERLDDRFRLLTSGSRTALPRHQTLRATIDWSYDPLSDGEKLLLRRLGVFVGGWTLESAEAVCSEGLPFDVLDGLQSLLDKSLIQHMRATAGDTRFIMLETIREYAVEKLDQGGEGDAIRMSHATAFFAVAEQSESGLAGPTFERWRPRMTEENDNLRAALRFCLESGLTEVALKMAAALKRSWWQHGQYSEARRWLEEALAAGGNASPEVRAKALVACGNINCMLEDYQHGLPMLKEGTEIYRALGDEPGVAEGLFQLAESLWYYGETDEAVLMMEESLKIFRQLNNGRRIAFCLMILANIASAEGQFTRSHALWEECSPVVQGLGDKSMTAIYHLHFALLPIREGHYAQALTHLETAYAIFREIGWQELLGGTLANLALTTLRLGDLVHANSLINEAREILIAIDITRLLIRLLEVTAIIEVARGFPLNAARMFGAAEARRESIHCPQFPVDGLALEKDIALGRTLTDEASWSAAWEQGRQMSLEEALAVAI